MTVHATGASCAIFAQQIPVLVLAGILEDRWLRKLGDNGEVLGVSIVLAQTWLAGTAEVLALTGLNRGHATPASLLVYIGTAAAALPIVLRGGFWPLTRLIRERLRHPAASGLTWVTAGKYLATTPERRGSHPQPVQSDGR